MDMGFVHTAPKMFLKIVSAFLWEKSHCEFTKLAWKSLKTNVLSSIFVGVCVFFKSQIGWREKVLAVNYLQIHIHLAVILIYTMFLKYLKCILNTSCGQVKLNSKYFKIYLVLRLTNIKKKNGESDKCEVKGHFIY